MNNISLKLVKDPNGYFTLNGVKYRTDKLKIDFIFTAYRNEYYKIPQFNQIMNAIRDKVGRNPSDSDDDYESDWIYSKCPYCNMSMRYNEWEQVESKHSDICQCNCSVYTGRYGLITYRSLILVLIDKGLASAIIDNALDDKYSTLILDMSWMKSLEDRINDVMDKLDSSLTNDKQRKLLKSLKILLESVI
jgi:hypothetical protein